MRKAVLTVAAGMSVMVLHGVTYVGYDGISLLYGELETGIGDIGRAENIISMLAQVDSRNLASEGVAEALGWAREYARRYPPDGTEPLPYDWEKHASWMRVRIFEYLAIKGDARDLDAVTRFNGAVFGALLKMRTEGVNVFDYDERVHGLGRPSFYPSVGNTGPQAVYAREILYRAWEEAGRDAAKIPPELLTMEVSLGGDGNPSCSVDLEKYGLSMPAIAPPPHRENFNFWNEGTTPHLGFLKTIMTVTFPDLAGPVRITPHMDRKSPGWEGLYIHVQKKPAAAAPPQEPQSQPAAEPPPPLADETQQPDTVAATDAPPCRLWLYPAAGLLCLCAILYFVRRKTKN